MYDLETVDSWWNGLSITQKEIIKDDRLNRVERARTYYISLSKTVWWNSKNVAQKSAIYHKFNLIYFKVDKPKRKYNRKGRKT